MKKRILSLCLAALMLATSVLFAACSSEGGKTPTTTPAVTDGNTPGSDAVTTEPPVTEAPCPIEDEDMDNYEFMIYECWLDKISEQGEFLYSEESGTVLDEAKYKRNSIVEEKFNISIVSENVHGTSTTGSNEGYGKFLKAKTAGDPTYDVVSLPAYDQTKLAQNAALYDLNALPHLDTTNVWWDQNVVEELTIKDTLFFLVGDYSIDAFDAAIAVTFNKELAKEKGINDLYTLVNEGKWTFDKFKEYTSLVSEDLNGDDRYTNMDLYGALSWDDAIYGVAHSAGGRCCTLDDDGNLVLELGTEAVYNAFSSYVEFSKEDCFLRYQVTFHENGTVSDNSGSTYGVEMFTNNQGLFFLGTVGAVSGNFRDMDVDYGILPLFKYNDTVDRYYSTISPYSARFLGCPIILTDEEIVGKVLETLCFYSSQIIVPAYYEKTLNGSVIRDEESSPMLNIIRDTRVYDLGYFYQPGNINKQLIIQFRAANADWMSTYKRLEKAAGLQLKNINKALTQQAEQWAAEK